MSSGRAEYLPPAQRSLSAVIVLSAVMATAALVGVEWVHHELERRISGRVEQQLKACFPQLEWHVGRVRQTTRGLLVTGLTASLPATDENSQPRQILTADQVQLEGDLDTRHLLLGSSRVNRVILVRPKLLAERLADRSWNLAVLKPAGPLFKDDKFGGLELRDGELQLVDNQGSEPRSFTVDKFQLQITPLVENSISQWILQAAATSREFESIRLDGQLDLKSRQWELSGAVRSLEATTLLVALVMEQLDIQPLHESTRLSCELNGQFQLAGSLGPSPSDTLPGQQPLAAAKIRGQCEAQLINGQLQDDRLPYSINGISAHLAWNGSGLRIDDITATSGTARLSGYYQRLRNNDAPSESIHLLVKQLTIDRHFIARLPYSIQRSLLTFAPVGTIDLNWSMETGAQGEDRQLAITLQDVDFRYAQFPYPLSAARGTIRLHNGILTLENCRAHAHGESLELSAHVEDPFEHPRGWLKLSASGPVPLDDELLAALKPKGQQFMRSLQPTGQILLEDAHFQYDGNRIAAHRQLTIQLVGGTIRYQSFPYPISRVEGRFQMVNNSWSFQDVTGIKGHTFLRCEGSVELGSEGSTLAIDLWASDMSLDDDLRDALGSLDLRTWRFWNSLNPSGSIDQVAITLRRDPGEERARLAVVVEKYRADSGSDRARGDGIRIKPSWFPYQLDNLSGSFSYHDGSIALTNFRAQHDDTVIRFAANSETGSSGEWSVQFHTLSVDNLVADHDLINALPGTIGPAVARLDPDGDFMLNGRLQLVHRNEHQKPLHASWDFSIETAGGQLGSSTRLENLFGGVRLYGSSDDQGARTHGQIEIDSMQIGDKLLTNISGPIWIDSSQVLLGRLVDPEVGEEGRSRLAGVLAGGTLELDAQLIQGESPRFIAQLQLSDADLAHLGSSLSASGRLTGRADAWLRLRGRLDGIHTWQGHGQVRLRRADLDQAPVIMAVRKLVPRNKPEPSIFSSTEIDLRIVADHIHLEKIRLKGDALSLEGSGWMNMDKEINLRLYTVVGRDEVRIPLIKAVLTKASRSLLEINVKGSLEKPEITSKALPELDDTLQRILTNLENRGPARVPVIARPVEKPGGVQR